MAELPQKVVSLLKAEGWTQGESRKEQSEQKTAEDDVIIMEPLSTVMPEPSTQEFTIAEPMFAEPAETSIEEILQSLQDSRLPSSTEIVLPKVYQRPSLELVEDVEIPDVSLLSKEEAEKVVESRFTKDGKSIMTDAEKKVIEKRFKHEVKVYTQCDADKLVYVDKRSFLDGKGKSVVVSDQMSRFGADQAITCVKELGMELITHCEGMLFDAAFMNPNYLFNLYDGKYGWMCPSDNYNWEKLDKKYLSMWFEDLSCFELIGTSSTVLIEDINVEELLEKQEMVRQEKVRINKEKAWNEKVAKLDLVEKVQERLKKDAEFEKVFNRLRSYFGDRADDAYFYEPEEIISLCQRKDCEKIVIILQDTFKAKKPEIADILNDLANNMETMTASYLRNFLRRHGYSSYELNKKNVEEMKKDAKTVQLNLIKMLDRDSANILLDSGDFNLPEGFDNRARFFSSQFPAIPTYRVVHWMYDTEKRCYLVKRVTGATHALYSKFEVVRLTEEDLYELADLPLHNPSKNEDARLFARFLKVQKREDFDAINFDNPASIRNEALRFLKAEGQEVREIVRDQYLCLKYEHVPRKSNHNLLDNLMRWYLDERTFEVVIERKGDKVIRFYHPAELNMFTKEDLIKLSKSPPVGKRIWNACILEFLQEVIKNLIACMPDEREIEQMRKAGEKKEKKRKAEAKKRSRRSGQQEKNIQIMD